MSMSERRLGKMMAERYLMQKEAASRGFGGVLEKGFNTFGTGLAMALPALALAGGIHAVRKSMKERDRKNLEAQADKVFENLKKSNSEAIAANPAAAREAFEALKKFSPTMAARPLVAESFIKNVATVNELQPDTIQSLLKAEKLVQEVEEGHSDPVGGFMSGLEGPLDVFGFKWNGAKSDKKHSKR